jgi:hypothetical protein
MTSFRAPKILTVGDYTVSGTPPHYTPDADPSPEVRIREPLRGHLSDAAAVEPYVSLPDAWVALRQRWSDYLLIATPCRDRLIDTVISGTGDTAGWLAAALAEQDTGGARTEINVHVAAAVNTELARLFEPNARPMYRSIAALFNSAAQRRDYGQLDELLPVLCAAARLCGADPDVAATGSQRLGLGLTVEPRKAHLRKVAQAFGQTDRWQTLTDLGVTIRAADNPLTTYPELPPRMRCIDTDRRVTSHDPLDGPLPTGWRGDIDGWENPQTPTSWSVVP